WQAIDQQLTAVLGGSQRSDDAERRKLLRNDLERIAGELAQVDRRLVAEFPQFAALVRPSQVDLAEVQGLIAANEVIVAYLVGQEQSFVFGINHDHIAWQRIALGRAALEAKVAAFRKGLDVDDLQKSAVAGKVELFDLGLAHELYAALIKPVASVLDGRMHLLIVPSGPPTAGPFHFLVNKAPETAKPGLTELTTYRNPGWLIEHHAVTLLPSVASFKALRRLAGQAASQRPFIGFGNPVLAGSAPKMVGATRATRAYSAFWRGSEAEPET